MFVKFRKNAQITIPAIATEQLQLKEGDLLECKFNENCIELVPLQIDTNVKKVTALRNSYKNTFPLKFQKLSVQCFGKFRLSAEGQILNMNNKKARELIAYLVCENGGPVKKEKLSAILWMDASDTHAMDNLYKVCRYLKHFSLQIINLPLTITRGSISLNMQQIDSDLHTFIECYQKRDKLEFCERAIDLYSGSLLAEEYYEWTNIKESFYEIKYLELLERLIHEYSKTGKRTKAQYYMEKYNLYDLDE